MSWRTDFNFERKSRSAFKLMETTPSAIGDNWGERDEKFNSWSTTNLNRDALFLCNKENLVDIKLKSEFVCSQKLKAAGGKNQLTVRASLGK